jgi:hypothetical protein
MPSAAARFLLPDNQKMKHMIKEQTKYFIYDTREFECVSEHEYSKWHSEDWERQQLPLFSKIIGGVLYTAQTFYNGKTGNAGALKPFSIFYMAGTSHNMRHYGEWTTFQSEYKLLIEGLNKMETIQTALQPKELKRKPKHACIVPRQACCLPKSIFECSYKKSARRMKSLSAMGCICERTMMISGRTSVISKGHLNRN